MIPDALELQIIPGILENEWPEIEKKIDMALPFTKTLHIDLLDGKFVENHTFTFPKPFEKYKDKVQLELHMMVENPIQYVDAFAAAGFTRFLGHVEKMPDQAAFIAKVQQVGEAGLALDGPTPLDALTVSLIDLDCLLIYTSEKVGFSGPPFKPERLDKVRAIRQKEPLLPIEVDGGINDTTILEAKNAGATRFVTTSYLFKTDQPKMQYDSLMKLIEDNS